MGGAEGEGAPRVRSGGRVPAGWAKGRRQGDGMAGQKGEAGGDTWDVKRQTDSLAIHSKQRGCRAEI